MFGGFLYYSLINFTMFMFSAYGANQNASTSNIRFFSGHWMAFYSAALVTLYSATQIQKKGLIRKCPNGHQVSLETIFCDKCGQPILDDVN